MHPMERLRSVARAEGAPPGLLAREAAGALAGLGPDAMALVTACRRLVERHPSAGPVWWLASRVLCAADPVAEAWRAAADLDADRTSAALTAALPEDATVVLLGWPEQVVGAVTHRGDVEVLVVSGNGTSSGLSRRLVAAGTRAQDVPDAGVATAVAAADVVVLEATAAGPQRFVATPGSHAAAAVGRTASVPVWLAAGVGRVLPQPLWAALEARLEASPAPAWARPAELVPLSLCAEVVGPGGPLAVAEVGPAAECPVAVELLKRPI